MLSRLPASLFSRARARCWVGEAWFRWARRRAGDRAAR